MVVKPEFKEICDLCGFENGVILYGSQATTSSVVSPSRFENGVILYGSQASYKSRL